MAEDQSTPVPTDLLEMLACPVCKTEVTPVRTDAGEPGLKCVRCHRIYPVRDGIPVMIESEAVAGDRPAD